MYQLFTALSRSPSPRKPARAARPARRARPQVEDLECRRVPTALVSGGVLWVDGAGAADTASVSLITVNGVSTYQAKVNGVKSNFAASKVTAGRVNFRGFGGNDSFTNSTALRTSALGGTGNDTVYGGTGADTVRGEAGHDYVSAGKGNDLVYGGDHNDTVHGGDGNDSVYAGNGNDSVYGNAGNDSCKGEAGADYLHGSTGNDTVHGGDGNDVLYGSEGNDSVYAGAGNDVAYGNDGSDWFKGEAGSDWFNGGAGNDTAYGGDADDSLYGGEGDDALYGEGGNDYLDGDGGYDRLEDELARMFDGERVQVPLVGDSPQDDGSSSGANSAYRMLHSYGHGVTYQELKALADKESEIVFGIGLNDIGLDAPPPALRDVVTAYKADAKLEQGVSFGRVLELLGQGKPVIALLKVGEMNVIIDTIPMLHYVCLSGFDQASGTLYYTDTNGVSYSTSYQDFEAKWAWTDGGISAPILSLLGVRGRTIIA